MKHITINFGLVASKKFPDAVQQRVLPRPDAVRTELPNTVLAALEAIGCTILNYRRVGSNSEPTLVATLEYPYTTEQLECKAPMKYEPYMRLYEVACFFAQDCVAVLPEGEEGLLVGANCRDWGCKFNTDKFINL